MEREKAERAKRRGGRGGGGERRGDGEQGGAWSKGKKRDRNLPLFENGAVLNTPVLPVGGKFIVLDTYQVGV